MKPTAADRNTKAARNACIHRVTRKILLTWTPRAASRMTSRNARDRSSAVTETATTRADIRMYLMTTENQSMSFSRCPFTFLRSPYRSRRTLKAATMKAKYRMAMNSCGKYRISVYMVVCRTVATMKTT